MKKYKIVILGMGSLIVFGLLLPQPLQALLVIVDSPIKSFFAIHMMALCTIVGLIQGICEECGYYIIFRTLLKDETSRKTAILFGLGRSVLELVYNIIILFTTSLNVFNFILILVSRIFGFGATIGLTVLDYISYQTKDKRYLVVSILFHAAINGLIYANETGLFMKGYNSEPGIIILFSILVIITSLLVNKKVEGIKK